MTTVLPQLEMDFAIGHQRPWLKVSEIASALEVSESHVTNLFDDAALDFVVDLRAEGGGRPYYRVLWEAWIGYKSKIGDLKFESGNRNGHREIQLHSHLARLPMVMGSRTIASFFNVSENLVLSWPSSFFDAAAPNSSQTFFRASKNQLLTFINKRRIQ